MANLHEVLEHIIVQHCQSAANWTGTTKDLVDAAEAKDPSLRTSVEEVDEVVRELHQCGRLRLDAPGGYMGPLRLRPGIGPSGARTSASQTITVHGGNVQIGDRNQQAITYGDVLQTLVNAINDDSGLPEGEKRDLVSGLQKVLAHPLTQTLIATAAAIGTTSIGR